MTLRRNQDVVREFDQIMRESRFEEATTYLDDDFELLEPASLSYGGTFRGRDGFLEMRRIFNETWSEFVRGEWLYAEGGDVVSRRAVVTFRSRATGRSAEFPHAEFFTMRDGRIRTAELFYCDTHALLALIADDNSTS